MSRVHLCRPLLTVAASLLFLCPAAICGAQEIMPVVKPIAGQALPLPDKLIITVSGLRNTNGTLIVTLFNSEKGFPDDPKKAFRTVSIDLSKLPKETKETVIVVEGIPAGTYAIAVLHDENNNGDMDTNFFGLPKEGIACSNNPRPKFRAPRFKEAKFDITVPEQSIMLKMWYL